jgi:hypothetical protein
MVVVAGGEARRGRRGVGGDGDVMEMAAAVGRAAHRVNEDGDKGALESGPAGTRAAEVLDEAIHILGRRGTGW